VEVEVRAIGRDELPTLGRVFCTVVGDELGRDLIADFGHLFEPERSLCAFDGDAMVATGGVFSFELTVPGGGLVSTGGLTLVSVLPTHRRRGIMRRMVQRHFEQAGARGEPISVLTASESLLYGRFGYGPATWSARFEIDRRHAAFAWPVTDSGRVRIVEGKEAARLLPAAFDSARRACPGQVSRSPAWWELRLGDPESTHHGDGTWVHVVHESAPGQVDGYASYTLQGRWIDGVPDGLVQVRELMAQSPGAAAALWCFCLNLDLTTAVELHNRPVDEPLRWLLADPRRLRITLLADFLWLRLLDLPGALAARRYGGGGQLVLEVADRLMPSNQGRFLLDADPNGAACTRTSAEPDVTLDIADLGAAYLGGVRFANLAAAGRVREGRLGGLARADALFATERAPWCATEF
jgi:predicted acetyltransferase